MNCKIVQDLLPLYHDGVCSDESRAAVEEHLPGCEACRRVLADMDTPLPEGGVEKSGGGAAAVERIAREWRRTTWRARLRGAALAVLVCVLLALGGWLAVDATVFPVSMESITLSDVRQLSDGRILYNLSIDNTVGRMTMRWKFGEDGDVWILAKRPLYRDLNSPGFFPMTLDLPVLNRYAQEDGVDTEIVRIWCGDGEDRILIWEEGMDLPAASAQDEASWGFDQKSAEYWANRQN